MPCVPGTCTCKSKSNYNFKKTNKQPKIVKSQFISQRSKTTHTHHTRMTTSLVFVAACVLQSTACQALYTTPNDITIAPNINLYASDYRALLGGGLESLATAAHILGALTWAHRADRHDPGILLCVNANLASVATVWTGLVSATQSVALHALCRVLVSWALGGTLPLALKVVDKICEDKTRGAAAVVAAATTGVWLGQALVLGFGTDFAWYYRCLCVGASGLLGHVLALHFLEPNIFVPVEDLPLPMLAPGRVAHAGMLRVWALALVAGMAPGAWLAYIADAVEPSVQLTWLSAWAVGTVLGQLVAAMCVRGRAVLVAGQVLSAGLLVTVLIGAVLLSAPARFAVGSVAGAGWGVPGSVLRACALRVSVAENRARASGGLEVAAVAGAWLGLVGVRSVWAVWPEVAREDLLGGMLAWSGVAAVGFAAVSLQ